MPHEPWFQQRSICCYKECGGPSGAAPAHVFSYGHLPEQARLADALLIYRTGMRIARHAATLTA